MAQYHIEISAAFALADFTIAINDEELRFAKFKTCIVETSDLDVVNMASFDEVDLSSIKPVAFVLKGSPVPAGTAKVWSGVILVQGTLRPVDAYR